jgi:ubiquinone/menaquinone biosynthesis C-methylase UbiE
MTDEATRQNQAVYDRIAAGYARRQAGRDESFADLMDALTARLPAGALVADLGCGPGHDGLRLARAGHRVLGVDRSAGMAAIAAQSLAGRVARGDLRQLPLASASLDGIWCCASLLHVPQDQTPAVLAEMRRVLRPTGHLALITAVGDGTRLEPVPYAPDAERWYFYRRAEELSGQLAAAGLWVLSTSEEVTNRHWLKALCVCGRTSDQSVGVV